MKENKAQSSYTKFEDKKDQTPKEKMYEVIKTEASQNSQIVKENKKQN